MKTFDVELADGSKDKLELPENLPYIIGKNAVGKLKMNVNQSGNKADIKIENAAKVATDAKEYIVRNMLSKTDTSVEVEDLSMTAFNQIANYYWEQVQSSKKK